MKLLRFFMLSLMLSPFFFSCSTNKNGIGSEPLRLKWNRDYQMSLKAQEQIKFVVYPCIETMPVQAKAGQDAADDPAIWVNQKNPSESLVLGTNKKGGIHVYDLLGQEQQFEPAGLINNIDLRDGFNFKGDTIALVGGSNRSDNTISFYSLDPKNRKLSSCIYRISSELDEVYGFSMYKQAGTQNFYAFVNGKSGGIEGYQIFQGDSISHQKFFTYSFGMQPEGMVVDDINGLLYIGVEQKGVFQIKLQSGAAGTPLLIPGSDQNNLMIKYDIEGLALFNHNDQQYLLVSSQGNFSYAVFEVKPDMKYLFSFKIAGNADLDGVEETDGLEISNAYLNEQFPNGILIVQDGFNMNEHRYKSQNFKYISLQEIIEILKTIP